MFLTNDNNHLQSRIFGHHTIHGNHHPSLLQTTTKRKQEDIAYLGCFNNIDNLGAPVDAPALGLSDADPDETAGDEAGEERQVDEALKLVSAQSDGLQVLLRLNVLLDASTLKKTH